MPQYAKARIRRSPSHTLRVVCIYEDYPADEHLQEDILDGRLQVTCFAHPVARCRRCRRWVKQAGPDEWLRKRIGPHARAMASFFRNDIEMSTRKVPRAIGGISGLTFTGAGLFQTGTLLRKDSERDPVAKNG